MTQAADSRHRARRWWTLLLGAPVIGTGYFGVVYLVAEAVCAEALQPFGPGALRVVVLGATGVTVAVLFGAGWRAHRLRHDRREAIGGDAESGELDHNRRFVAATALVLAGAFVLFVVMVGAPVVALTLC